MKITIKKGQKKSWFLVKSIMKHAGYEIDLRRSTKKLIPLYIGADCCGGGLEIRRKKDFPLEDKKCKCGNLTLIKWIEL